MTLIVEDGSGLPAAESYVAVATVGTYASNRGLTWAPPDQATAEAACRRATAYIDNTYRPRFPGFRRNFRNQALEWPRTSVVDITGYPVPYDQLPVEVINATCEAAVRELAKPGGLAPDVVPGQIKKMARVEGAVTVEYAVGSGDAASQQPISTLIDGILAPLLGLRQSYFAMAARG